MGGPRHREDVLCRQERAHIGLHTEAALLSQLDARVEGVPWRLALAPVTVLGKALPEAAPGNRSGLASVWGRGGADLLVRLEGDCTIERVGEHCLEPSLH